MSWERVIIDLLTQFSYDILLTIFLPYTVNSNAQLVHVARSRTAIRMPGAFFLAAPPVEDLSDKSSGQSYTQCIYYQTPAIGNLYNTNYCQWPVGAACWSVLCDDERWRARNRRDRRYEYSKRMVNASKRQVPLQ